MGRVARQRGAPQTRVAGFPSRFWWALGHRIGTRPLISLGVLLTLAGIQCLLFGLLAELVLHLAAREEFEVDAVAVGDRKAGRDPAADGP